MPFEIKEISDVIDFDNFKTEWSALIDELPHISFFLSWEWLNTWWHTYSTSGDQLRIITIKKNQQLVAIFPLYVQNRQCIRFIGTGEKEADEAATEYLDIICSKKLAIEVNPLLISYFKESKLAFIFNNYLEESTLEKFITTLSASHWHNKVTCGISYRAKLSNTVEEFTDQCSKSLVKRLNRAQKKFYGELNGKIESYSTTEKFSTGFNTLKKLHKTRWHNKNEKGVFVSEKFLSFHQKFTQHAIANHWLTLEVMSVNNMAISAIYCLQYKQTRYFYQSGVQDNFKPNISPGYLMHLIQIESAIKKELLYYDYMKGSIDNSYKAKLSNNTRYMYNTTLIKKSYKNTLTKVKWQIKQLRDALS